MRKESLSNQFQLVCVHLCIIYAHIHFISHYWYLLELDEDGVRYEYLKGVYQGV